MNSQFVADFEAYMPAEFNGATYGKAGILATADEAGIDVCVVFPGGLPPDPKDINAELLQEAKGESRILPGCLINPTLGPDASDDLKRCVDAGARTVKLMAAAHRYRLDAPCVDPIMELAHSLGIPATIHSGSPMSGCSPEFIGTLAQRHPDVVIIMDHMGYREWTGLAVQAAVENPKIYLGTTLIAAAEPISIKNIARSGRIGADRIVFGTNSPSGMAVNGVNGIRNIGFTDEEAALILGENLKAIYGL
ncbi:MAG: amidohydrolase family protein [Candidatus Poribacteria bacterium]|nr:amidohydrolase family protein [Candidatus Poribacteria bacterium]